MEQINALTQNPYLANALQLFLNPGPYFLVLVFIFLAVFFYGMRSGRGRAVLLLLSLYIATVLTDLFPYEDNLLESFQTEPFFLKAGIFLVAILVSFNILLRSPLRTFAVQEKRSPILHVLLLSMLTLGIFVSYLTTILPEEHLAGLNHPVFQYFKTQNAQFWWSLAGLAALAFIRKP